MYSTVVATPLQRLRLRSSRGGSRTSGRAGLGEAQRGQERDRERRGGNGERRPPAADRRLHEDE
jgi:hypothetical protein